MTATCLTYLTALCLIRISVLLFYRRLASPAVPRAFVYCMWSCIGLEILTMAVCLSTLCFPCHPLTSYWLRKTSWASTHTWTCIDQDTALLTMACVEILLDCIAIGVPFSLFWRLSLPRRQRIGLVITVSGGVFVTAFGVARAGFIYHFGWGTYDTTWTWYLFALASNIEVLLAAIVATSPALKYYIQGYLNRSDDINSNVHFLNNQDKQELGTMSYSDKEGTSASSYELIKTSHLTSSSSAGSLPHLPKWDPEAHELLE